MKLEEARKKIDDIDERLVELFIERMEVSGEISKEKAAKGLAIYNPEREREVLDRVSAMSGEYEKYTDRLFRTIMELSKTYQRGSIARPTEVSKLIEKIKADRRHALPESASVACQGVAGAYSQLACEKLFKRGHITFMKSFEAVFDAVGSGLCEFGVLPIDNSTMGSVKQVYDLMMEKRFSIVSSTKLFIKHELLAKEGTDLDNLEAVYSHNQGLMQCGEFLKSLPESVKIIPCDNTAMAAKAVSESDAHIAAISSHNCAELYGLVTIADHIQNSMNNYTKFIVITKEPRLYEGANHITLLLTCDHRPGALFEIMQKFAALGVNLSKLESHPIPGEDFKFMFFFEIEASVMDDDTVTMLSELEQTTQQFQFLGNYTAI